MVQAISHDTVNTAIAGWGMKQNTLRSREYAKVHQLPYYTLEDGFIRSIGLGVNNAEPFGFVLDSQGIFYDSHHPSDLEDIIRNAELSQTERSRSCIKRIVSIGACKYNNTWAKPQLPPRSGPRVLIIDQTVGDLSVQLGGGSEQTFNEMLHAAQMQFPEGTLIIKTHPDVIAKKRKGYLTEKLPSNAFLLKEDCNPIELLKQVDSVFTVTSQMGFEALMVGKPVHCFGLPFYAGWGLTHDQQTCSRRGCPRTLEQVFEAAYLRYSQYADPVLCEKCSLEKILQRIEIQKKATLQSPAKIFCFGFSLWKHKFVQGFLPESSPHPHFASSIKSAERRGMTPQSHAVIWGQKYGDKFRCELQKKHIPVARMEDGFIRSVGLGADFIPPLSLILDSRGIYFDPRTESDLEWLLNHRTLSLTENSRARKLQSLLIDGGVTKYNWGDSSAKPLFPHNKSKKILVPGQVEDDASIRLGTLDIHTNAQLLAAVRDANPEAFILYKPHPDVLSGNRKGSLSPHEETLADAIVSDTRMDHCLELCDEVHTMTSLAGFEALIRGKKVYTYGMPFYSGWGLTSDRHRVTRRTKHCSLEELIFCTLIEYPRYVDYDTGFFISPEDAIKKIEKNTSLEKAHKKTPKLTHWRLKIENLVSLLKDSIFYT
ncbi:capsular polysaccharide biosynthesis protein [Desulfobaculum bizertense]|nr:capsular polysaccharide biosynthesis protein [Desulfobaculum bizertense]